MQLVKMNNAQVSASIKQLPVGFLRETVSTSGRVTLRPVPRVEFAKAHGLKNAEAKRQYRAYLQKFTVAISAQFAADVAEGGVAKEIAVGKSGVRTYKVGDVKAPAPAKAVRAVDATPAELEAAAAKAAGMSIDDYRMMLSAHAAAKATPAK